MTQEVGVAGWVQQQNVSRQADGTEGLVRMTRDGSICELPWKQAIALEGRTFVVNYGSTASNILGHTSTATAQPDTSLDVPAGVVVIPIQYQLSVFSGGGTGNYIYLQMANNTVGSGTSSPVTQGPQNMRTDLPFASRCTARQAFTANGTAPTNPAEVWSVGATSFLTQSGLTGNSQVLTYFVPLDVPPILVGPSNLSLFTVATTTAISFKAILEYIELPASAVS